MNTNKTPSVAPHASHDRPVFEQEIDTYRVKGKLSEPTVCKVCKAVFHEGRWQWIATPIFSDPVICPACQRIKDDFPAGYVTLQGPFFRAHEEEIMHLIKHHTEHERNEHPMKRIIKIMQNDDNVLITTTDMHLARGLGEVVHHAYQGELDVDHVSGENLVRVHWSR